jgi:eukaryotic-like serine/threonine-protein kinase
MLQTAPGLIVTGRYELLRELARGGMGSVWVATDTKLRRSVAIKVMMPTWVDSTDALQRFEREAMAVAQLRSPHVVQIFDYGIEQECPYIVMELMEGEDLRQRLQTQQRLDLETAGRILVQTAKALSAAHAEGIIHRDLKPGNIFLAKSRDEEIVKVLDFGVAKVDRDPSDNEERTKAGTLLGTPQYMAPEQARALPNIDHRADLWSLGVIMYRALTGRLPFVGKSAADVIVKICTVDPARPTAIAPDLPPEVDRFFKRALAREPDDRFESARAMAIAFSRIAPSSFPSLNMPDPMPDIAEVVRDRQKAQPDMDWDDEDSSPPTRAGKAAAAKPKFVPKATDKAKPGTTPKTPDAPLSEVLGIASRGAAAVADKAANEPSGSIMDAVGESSGAERAEQAAAAAFDLGASPVDPLGLARGPRPEGSSVSASGTLSSGLVDATPAATPTPKTRSPLVWALAVAALGVGLAVVIGSGMLSGKAAEEPRHATDAQPAQIAPGTEEQRSPGGPAAPPATGPATAPSTEPTVAASSSGASPSTSAATRPAPPDATGAVPGVMFTAKPPATGTLKGPSLPKAKPPAKGGDPFSDRL